MKVNVKVTGSGPALFGGGGHTVEAEIMLDERMNATTAALTDLVGALTISATTLIAAAVGDDSEEGVGETSDGDTEDQSDEKGSPEIEPAPYVEPGDPDWEEARAAFEEPAEAEPADEPLGEPVYAEEPDTDGR